jgi:tetratricopeptide (TPR) repeat protein
MKKWTWISLAPLLLAISCGNSDQQERSRQQELLRQQEIAAAEYLQKTFSWVDDALDDVRTAPKDATVRLDVVLSDLETAITKYPDSAPMQLMMGRALILHDCAFRGNNCSVRAKGHLTKAIEMDPKLVRAHVLLAHDAINSGCLPCALPHIEAARVLEANSPYVLEVRGRHAHLSGWNEAEKLYLQAIDAFPNLKKRWQALDPAGLPLHHRQPARGLRRQLARRVNHPGLAPLRVRARQHPARASGNRRALECLPSGDQGRRCRAESVRVLGI